jgi:hypothetical protein
MADIKSRPTILSPDHIRKAIVDERFYAMLPEFMTLKKKLQASHVDIAGCKPCQKRRAAISLTSDFVSILNTLSSDGLQRIKKYVGADRLLVRATNRTTGKLEMREV